MLALPVRGRFALVTSLEFDEELGNLLYVDEESGKKILSLIDRIVRAPFEPSLISECGYLDDPHNFFRYSLIEGLIVEWNVNEVACRSPRYRIYNEDWEVHFLRIKRVNC